MNLAIYGAGGLGRELLELARQINNHTQKWEMIFFVIDNEYYNPQVNKMNGAEVITFEKVQSDYKKRDVEFVIAQGEPIERKKLKEKLDSYGFKLATLIHPNVYIPESSSIGLGTVIQSNCYISCNVKIGDIVLLQPSVNIGHDCEIGMGTNISGLCNLAGRVNIGEYSYIGISTIIMEKIIIGNWSIISMGSAVFRNIEDGVIAVGNPARIMKRNENYKVFK